MDRRACWLCCGLLVVGPAAARDGYASWGTIDITPPLGIALGGRGNLEESSQTIADSLRAQVTILSDGQTQPIVLFSLDLIGLPTWFSAETSARITARTGIPAERIVFNCSHTHSGPMTFRELFAGGEGDHPEEEAYLRRVAEDLVALVDARRDALVPVSVRLHTGICHAAINRRWEAPTGQMLMAPNPEAPRDTTVWILHLADEEEGGEALLFSYACHPNLMRDIARTCVSADFPGAVRRGLGRADRHVQFFQGAAGDLRLRPRGDLKKRIFPPATTADLQRVTTDLVTTIEGALAGPGEELRFDLMARRESVRLPRGRPPSAEEFQRIAQGTDSIAARGARYWLAQLAQGGLAHEADQWTVGLLRLTPACWIAYMSGEPVFEWDAVVRQIIPHASIDLWGYCQAATGYLPVDQILFDGGYEVRHSNHLRAWNPAPFGAGVDDSIGGSLADQFKVLQHADNSGIRGD